MAVGLKKRRRIQMVVAGAVLLAAATGIVGYAMRDGIEFFRAPSQLASHPPRPGERFRLGGLVEKGSVVRDGQAVRFVVTDGGASVPVTFSGLLPDLFREGQGVIATGTPRRRHLHRLRGPRPPRRELHAEGGRRRPQGAGPLPLRRRRRRETRQLRRRAVPASARAATAARSRRRRPIP